MYDKSPIKNRIVNQPAVKDDCPKCGAGSDERELISRDFLGIEVVHMHYLCKKCGGEIIEEFKSTHPFLFKSACGVSVVRRLGAIGRLFTCQPVVTKYIKVEFINNIIVQVGYVASMIPFGLSIFAQPR